MHKYRYISFGDGVPKDIEQEYNRMCRKEQYQEETDFVHGVVHFDYDGLLHTIVDLTTLPQYQRELEHERIRRRRLELIPIALEWLKEKYPDDYELIFEHYLSADRANVLLLAERYGVTHQAICKRLAAAREHLKEYIILHENTEE